MPSDNPSQSRKMRDEADKLLREKAAAEAAAAAGQPGADQLQADPEAETVHAEAEYIAADREADDDYLTNGIRADQSITAPLALPVQRGPDVQDWIMANLCAKGRGTQLAVCRVAGRVTDTADRVTEWQGKQLASIELIGLFRMQSYLTGEEYQAGSLFLPIGYAKQVKAAIVHMRAEGGGDVTAPLDVDVGLLATGRTIPYQWTVRAYVRAKLDRSVDALWNRRRPAVQIEQTQRPVLAAD